VADAFSTLAITGRDGVKLTDAWRTGQEAYLGTTVAGFPTCSSWSVPTPA
jgi:hypothetical protein